MLHSGGTLIHFWCVLTFLGGQPIFSPNTASMMEKKYIVFSITLGGGSLVTI